MIKKNKYFAEKGFTLIEFLLYMAVFSILLIALFQILSNVLDTQTESEAASSVQEDADFILARLSHDILQSQAIVIPSSLGSSGSSLQLTINGVSYTYSVNSNNLVLTNNVASNEPMNGYDTTISNVLFTRVGNANGKNGIAVSFTLTSKTIRSSGHETQSFSTIIGTR